MDAHIDFIVKLGGSAITNKSEFETAKPDNIKKAAETLFRCWQKGKRFIIVHGAGSFGHHQAKKYGVKLGTNNPNNPTGDTDTVKQGFCLTRLSVCTLNALVTKSLVEEGIPAVAQSACGVWKTKSDEVVCNPCSQISELVKSGYVPVLHGDCVLDEEKGCTILSGDTICEVLCDYFKPARVVFASDVAGIYNKPPVSPDAMLLPLIIVYHNGKTKISTETDTNKHDVTGGIQFKIESAVRIVHKREGKTVVKICDMDSPDFANICMDISESNIKSTEIRYL